ncbi:MAG: secretin N-terminal domain-containing protein, partial [Planctomycetota bacterium]
SARLTVDVKNKKLVAWGTPEEQAIIRKAVESLLQRGRGGGTAETTPRLEVYRLRKADPAATLTLLQSLVPDAQLSVDTQTKSLAALAVPADHKTIKSTVEKVEAEGPAEDQPRFETYPIHGADVATGGATFLSALQPLVPSARLTIDVKNRQLVAWGTPEEQAIIRKAVESLLQRGRGGGMAETTPQLEVYHLTKADPTSTLTLLQSLVPDAQLSLDPQTNSLVALAIASDQQTIKATLDQLQPEKLGPDSPVLRFHPLIEKPSENLVAVLQELAPKAQVTLDAENDRVMAVATPADHEIIKSTIEEYEAGTPPDEPNRLIVYSVTARERKRFEALLPTLSQELPGAEIIGEAEPGEMAVWAKPTQHLVIAGIVEELKGGAPGDGQFRLAVYPIKSAAPQSVLTVLQKLFPGTEFVLDEKTKRLMVWTSPGEQEKIKSALDEMDSGVPGELQEELVVYPVPDLDPQIAVQMLQALVTDVQFSTDTTAGTILAWGRKSDHAIIAKTLQQMSEKGPPAMAPTAVVYTMESITPTSAMQILALAVPKAKLTPGPGADQFVAWARPQDHQVIQSTLENIDVDTPEA